MNKITKVVSDSSSNTAVSDIFYLFIYIVFFFVGSVPVCFHHDVSIPSLTTGKGQQPKQCTIDRDNEHTHIYNKMRVNRRNTFGICVALIVRFQLYSTVEQKCNK